MRIVFSGSPRGLAALTADLDQAGIGYSYQAPYEDRSGGMPAPVEVVLHLTYKAAEGAAITAGGLAVKAAVAKFNQRNLGSAKPVDEVAGSE